LDASARDAADDIRDKRNPTVRADTTE